jgi:predicted ATPase
MAKTNTINHLLLQIKDAPFTEPILAKFASDGALKMLAYLAVLHDPDPPQLNGVASRGRERG